MVCQLEVTLLHQIFGIVLPLLERRPRHLEEGASSGAVSPVILRHSLKILCFDNVQRSRCVWIDSHDKICIDLDLLELVTIDAVSVASKLVVEIRELVIQDLSFLVSLGLGWRRIPTSSIGLGLRSCSVRCGKRLGCIGRRHCAFLFVESVFRILEAVWTEALAREVEGWVGAPDSS